MTFAEPGAPNILIAGLHKSGTTGAYDTVRSAVSEQDDYAFLYEPKSPEPFLALGRYTPYRPVVAKLLVHQLDLCALRYDDFDRRIMMIRDPRDVVVSRLLFRPMLGTTSYNIDIRTLDPFVDALKEKEQDPQSHSVKGLHDLADQLGIYKSGWRTLRKQMQHQMHLIDNKDFFVLRYEDFIDGRLDEPSEYLGISLADKHTADDGWKSHISRSMKYGEWKRWFLDEDVEYFGTMFSEYLERFGYSDWGRDAHPRIDPSTSSEYIAGKVTKQITDRQDRRRDTWTVDSVRNSDELHHIETMARDGRAIWSYRVALVYDRSTLFGPDRERALRWARYGAELGNAEAMGLLARFLRERDTTDRAVSREERFWQREYDILSGNQRTTSRTESQASRSAEDLANELKRTRQSLKQVRSSSRYRLGSAVAEAVTNPKRAGSMAVDLARLARREVNKKNRARPSS